MNEDWILKNYNARLHKHCIRCRCCLSLLIKLPKLNKQQMKPSRTKRRLRLQKTSLLWNVFWKHKTINWLSRHFVSGWFRESRLGCPRITRVTSSDEQGITSKNNLRGITLGIRPKWGIHSLILIISCLRWVIYALFPLKIDIHCGHLCYSSYTSYFIDFWQY